MRRSASRSFLVFALAAIFVSPVSAETVELVTYYPTSANTGDLHVRSLTVGTAYQNETPDDGMALIGDQVGIGTTSPQGSLHVVGPDNTADKVLFMPGVGGAMRVGIGTDNPQSELEIYRQDEAYLRVSGTGINATPENFSGLELGGDLPAGGAIDRVWQIAHKRGGAGAVNDLHVNYFDGAAWSTKMTIQPAGNVGIGTASPAEKLQIVGTRPRLRIDSGTAGGGGPAADDARIILKSNTPGAQGRFDLIATTAGDFRLAVFNASETQVGDYIVVKQSGRMGIGTDNPQSMLDVNGEAHVRDLLRVRTGSNQNSIVSLDGSQVTIAGSNEQSAFVVVRGQAQGSYVDFYTGTGGMGDALNFRINPNGSAGLRGALSQNSDLRLKTDVRPIPDALERVARLRGVNFRWKDASYGSGVQMGVIGQEMEKEFPELVTSNSEGEKSVSYTQMTAALIEAIKELKSENDLLKKRVKTLEQVFRQ